MKRALVLGGAGFIGMALTTRLKAEGCHVRSLDWVMPTFSATAADEFKQVDLRDYEAMTNAVGYSCFDEVYQLACDLGGAGYIYSRANDTDIILNNVAINANAARLFTKIGCGRFFFASSACVYSDQYAVKDAYRFGEEAAGTPSTAYGWEKLFSEQLYETHRVIGLNVCIARFSTIYGPGCAFKGGREMAVAAICRKAIDAPDNGELEVWGDGTQIRPLVYIDDLTKAITKLVRCKDFNGPVNIATKEFTSCTDIAQHAIELSDKQLTIKYVPGPTGKQVLNMSTDLAEKHLSWRATAPFAYGIERTFEWIAQQKRIA